MQPVDQRLASAGGQLVQFEADGFHGAQRDGLVQVDIRQDLGCAKQGIPGRRVCTACGTRRQP